MKELLAALAAALRSLLSGRMMGLVLWPLLGAAVIWIGSAWIFWGDWIHFFQWALSHGPLARLLGTHAVAVVGGALAWLLVLPCLLLLVLATALLITSIFGMPAMVREIARRYYPQLHTEHGGTNTGSLANALIAVVVYLVLMVLSLPLWFILPLGGVVLPLLLNGWLNARLFRYDALSEHASREEYRALVRGGGRRMFLLGIVLTALQLLMSYSILLLPVALLFLPVYSGLAFVHFALGRLQQLRTREDGQRVTIRDS